MNLRHLETFLAVARLGGLARAADALDVAPSTVSLHMSEVQKELGVVLVERAGRGIRLTDAGRQLAERAESVVLAVQRMRTLAGDLREGYGGSLRIGAVEPAASQRLPDALSSFGIRRPTVRVTVEVAGTTALCRAVEQGRLDIALCSAPPAPAVRFEPLFVERLSLLVPRDHPLAAAPTVRPDDLRAHRLLVTEEGCAYRQATVEALAAHGVSLAGVMEIGSIGALASSVAAGLGIALVPLGDRPPPSGTVTHELADLPVGLVIGIVLPGATLRPPAGLALELAQLLRPRSADAARPPS